MKYYVYEVTVEGSGDFPVDMLRYDSCYPATSDDVINIGTNQYSDRGQRKVTIRTHCHGRSTQPFHVDRWRSFQWNVLSGTARSWNVD